MNGTTSTGGGYAITVGDLNWKIVRMSDFNGDGRADICIAMTSPGPATFTT